LTVNIKFTCIEHCRHQHYSRACVILKIYLFDESSNKTYHSFTKNEMQPTSLIYVAGKTECVHRKLMNDVLAKNWKL